MNHQEILLKHIRKQLSKKDSMNDEISSILNISYDAAHRRVSGKSKFSIDQTIQLTNHFKLQWMLFFQKKKL